MTAPNDTSAYRRPPSSSKGTPAHARSASTTGAHPSVTPSPKHGGTRHEASVGMRRAALRNTASWEAVSTTQTSSNDAGDAGRQTRTRPMSAGSHGPSAREASSGSGSHFAAQTEVPRSKKALFVGAAIVAALLLLGAAVFAIVTLTRQPPAAPTQEALAPAAQPGAVRSTLVHVADRPDDQAQFHFAERMSQAAYEAFEPIVEPYGEDVAVTFVPVGHPAALVSYNGDYEHRSASIIKVLILARLLSDAQQGFVDLDEYVRVDYVDIVDEDGAIGYESVGSYYSLLDLARLMTVASDNVAANLLIDYLGIDAINELADELGLYQTALIRKFMDMTHGPEGVYNHTSSNDLAFLFEMFASGTFGDPIVCELAVDWLSQQYVDEGLAAGVEGRALVAHKTGELDFITNDGGIVYGPYPYVLVVLVENVDGDEARALIYDVSAAVYDAVEVL